MAPRKNSSSSGTTRRSGKSSTPSLPKTPATAATTATRVTSGRVTKNAAPGRPQATAARMRASQSNGRAPSVSASGSRHVPDRNRHVHYGDEEAEGTDTNASPAKAQGKRKQTTQEKESPSIPAAQVSARPDFPDYRPPMPRQRNNAKPDPAKGDSYEMKEGEHVVFDSRETYGYLMHYDDLYKHVSKMQDKILDIGNYFAQWDIGREASAKYLRALDAGLSEEARTYIGCIATGGPCGLAGWEEILLDLELRKALVAGMIWKALKEHVFESLWFGAEPHRTKEMEDLEYDMKGTDCGFMRRDRRVKAVRETILTGQYPGSIKMQVDREQRVNLVEGIIQLIKPLYDYAYGAELLPDICPQLKEVVDMAIKLNHCMRLDSTAICSWACISKDTPYDPEYVRISSEQHWNQLMDPANRSSSTMADPDQGLNEKKLAQVRRYAFLNRIVVFEPLEAYRKGGWRPDSDKAGLRRKLIIKGTVACRWGATRKNNPAEGAFFEFRECRDQLGKAKLGKQWWMEKPADPALGESTVNVPILGEKGKGHQPNLHGFQPRLYATI